MPALDQQIKEIIADQLRVDLARVTPDKTIIGDLWADSVAVVELTAAIEEAFDIEVPDYEVPTLKTVGDVLFYVRARVAEKGDGESQS